MSAETLQGEALVYAQSMGEDAHEHAIRIIMDLQSKVENLEAENNKLVKVLKDLRGK